jgi:hypothetical protein
VIARLGRALAGLALAALFAAGLAWLASRPLGEEPEGAAVRLALRTALANVEVCRDRTPEELAALPVHMRQPRVCEDRRPDYRLELRADGERLLSRRLKPPGVHRDRPLTVDALVPVTPGRRQLEVHFAPEGLPDPSAAGPLPPTWTLSCAADLAPGRILLILLDGAELRVAGGECAGAPERSAAASGQPRSPGRPRSSTIAAVPPEPPALAPSPRRSPLPPPSAALAPGPLDPPLPASSAPARGARQRNL